MLCQQMLSVCQTAGDFRLSIIHLYFMLSLTLAVKIRDIFVEDGIIE